MRKCGYNADTAETKREWRHSRTTAKRQRKRKASLLFQPTIRFGDIDRIHLDVSPTYESFSPRNRSSSPRQPPQTCGLSERELIAHTCSPSQRRRAGVLCVVDLGPVSFAPLSLSFLSLFFSLFPAHAWLRTSKYATSCKYNFGPHAYLPVCAYLKPRASCV